MKEGLKYQAEKIRQSETKTQREMVARQCKEVEEEAARTLPEDTRFLFIGATDRAQEPLK